MIEVTNRSGEPIVLRVRGADVELNPGESFELQGYQPLGWPRGEDGGGVEMIGLRPRHDSAQARSPQGWITSSRPDGPGAEPQRNSRGSQR